MVAAYARDPLLSSDDAHARMMERGSETLAEAINYLRRGIKVDTPRTLHWSRVGNNNGIVPGSRSWVKRARTTERVVEKEERARAQRTLRDPCPFCGVRQDIGCKHVRHLSTIAETLTHRRHLNAAWEREVREAKSSPDTQGGEG